MMVTAVRNLEVGSYNKLPHYAVFGSPCDFYVWVREHKSIWDADFQGASNWINHHAMYHKLRALHQKRDKKSREEFIKLIKKLRRENPKD